MKIPLYKRGKLGGGKLRDKPQMIRGWRVGIDIKGVGDKYCVKELSKNVSKTEQHL